MLDMNKFLEDFYEDPKSSPHFDMSLAEDSTNDSADYASASKKLFGFNVSDLQAVPGVDPDTDENYVLVCTPNEMLSPNEEAMETGEQMGAVWVATDSTSKRAGWKLTGPDSRTDAEDLIFNFKYFVDEEYKQKAEETEFTPDESSEESLGGEEQDTLEDSAYSGADDYPYLYIIFEQVQGVLMCIWSDKGELSPFGNSLHVSSNPKFKFKSPMQALKFIAKNDPRFKSVLSIDENDKITTSMDGISITGAGLSWDYDFKSDPEGMVK